MKLKTKANSTPAEWLAHVRQLRAGCLILVCTCGIWFEFFRPQQRAIYRAAGESLYRVVSSEFCFVIWAGSK